jgi:hypothetical protein
MKQPLQPPDTTTKQAPSRSHGVLRRDQIRSPYFNTREACEHLRYLGKHRLRSLYRFIKREGIRTARDGRRVLLVRADVERAIGAVREA